MPLSDIQHDILLALAAQRDPESYVAGGTTINRDGPRISADIDIFQDLEDRVAEAATADAAILTAEAFDIKWLRREPGLHAAIVRRDGDATRLEWARDSDFRFFATVRDDLFGYRLHLLDIATNKALAAAGRREPRDVLDLLHIHERHIPLGAIVWAAVGKDPGFSPASLIAEISRNARYRQDDYADLATRKPVDAAAVARSLRDTLRQAEVFVRAMPAGRAGLAFLDQGRVVQPEVERLDTYESIAGCRRGHWPSSPDIGSAMIEGGSP